MTNNWADMANATLFLIWGANPVENHPASVAHMNRARFPKQFFPASDPRSNKTPATMVVVDPRKNRTALQADHYIRIRPGTDIAFANGLLNYMITKIESGGAGAAVKTKYLAYLDQKSDGTFFTDGDAGLASTNTTLVPNQAKYTDARFILKADGSDYEREKIVAATGLPAVAEAANLVISDFPKKAASADSAGTVYTKLKEHVSKYDVATVVDICGCQASDIPLLGDLLIAHSRHASTGTAHPSGTATQEDPRSVGYRATTILYAMGITQHTCGAQNVKSFSVLQSILGNNGRAGGGINALRGIHNVQGSTDMGLLYGNIIAYSGNPGTQVDGGPNWSTNPSTNNAFGKYVDALWGLPVNGANTRANMNGSYDDAYNTGAMQLQQRGFYNLTLKWFGDYGTINGLAYATAGERAAKRAKVDACYSLWPKGNGDNHIKMFRNMALADGTAGRIKAVVVWGQNPAITEPNQGKIRDGLYNLDTLVCVDMFLNETAASTRRPDGVTYLIPAAAHVEKAGSSTNSGRVLQWRYEARRPAGNSKDDTELLLRFAKALDVAGAFSHIKAAWTANGIFAAGDSVYDKLYAAPYGTFNGTSGYNDVQGDGELANLRLLVSDPVTYNTAANNLKGSEWVNECIYREFTTGVGGGGTSWIYTEGYDLTNKNLATGAANAAPRLTGLYTPWTIANRAKSRDRQDPYGTMAFHKWGYSWLVNRRVLYNNGELTGDQTDFFMSPDSVSRILAPKAMPTLTLGRGVFNYSRWYRTHSAPTGHTLADVPLLANGDTPSTDYHVLPGRFPGHTEPYESPRPDLAAKWGYNTSTSVNTSPGYPLNLVYPGSQIGDVDTYPLVLTTIRCVEHFQGGPITRNNWHNVELEPEPWIELNSIDAHKYGIKDGDMVRVISARNETISQVPAVLADLNAKYGLGFRARVGVGLQDSQRVAPGVVAIPWHWGEKGLSTGSRANDITIDAMDANTTIPEFKACLCRIDPM